VFVDGVRRPPKHLAAKAVCVRAAGHSSLAASQRRRTDGPAGPSIANTPAQHEIRQFAAVVVRRCGGSRAVNYSGGLSIVYVAEGGNFGACIHQGKAGRARPSGEKTQRLSNLVGVLRSGNSGAIDESGLGAWGSNSTSSIRGSRLSRSGHEGYLDPTGIRRIPRHHRRRIAAGGLLQGGVAEGIDVPHSRCEHGTQVRQFGCRGQVHGKCDRSGDAGLLNLTPEGACRARARRTVSRGKDR
jgi:hypothetical protein